MASGRRDIKGRERNEKDAHICGLKGTRKKGESDKRKGARLAVLRRNGGSGGGIGREEDKGTIFIGRPTDKDIHEEDTDGTQRAASLSSMRENRACFYPESGKKRQREPAIRKDHDEEKRK